MGLRWVGSEGVKSKWQAGQVGQADQAPVAARGKKTWDRRLVGGPPVVGMGVPTRQLRTPRSWILQGTAGIWFLLYLPPTSAVFTFSMMEASGCGETLERQRDRQ